jgi:DNA-binding NarL/FixJ family response regulator
MQALRIQLNAASSQWLQSMARVFGELTPWEIITNDSISETIEVVEKVQPDVLIWKVDDNPGIMDLDEIKTKCPLVIPVMVVNDPNQIDMTQFMHFGACGCLPNRLRPRQVVQAIELIATAGISCFPRWNPEQSNKDDLQQVPGSTKLTVREREILSLLCQNNSNQEIAEMLCVSESTVKTHLHNIYKKMGKKKRGEVLAAVYSIDEARRTIQSH